MWFGSSCHFKIQDKGHLLCKDLCLVREVVVQMSGKSVHTVGPASAQGVWGEGQEGSGVAGAW